MLSFPIVWRGRCRPFKLSIVNQDPFDNWICENQCPESWNPVWLQVATTEKVPERPGREIPVSGKDTGELFLFFPPWRVTTRTISINTIELSNEQEDRWDVFRPHFPQLTWFLPSSKALEFREIRSCREIDLSLRGEKGKYSLRVESRDWRKETHPQIEHVRVVVMFVFRHPKIMGEF